MRWKKVMFFLKDESQGKPCKEIVSCDSKSSSVVWLSKSISRIISSHRNHTMQIRHLICNLKLDVLQTVEKIKNQYSFAKSAKHFKLCEISYLCFLGSLIVSPSVFSGSTGLQWQVNKTVKTCEIIVFPQLGFGEFEIVIWLFDKFHITHIAVVICDFSEPCSLHRHCYLKSWTEINHPTLHLNA